MGVRYDKHGICTTCRLPGSGFVADGVCACLDNGWDGEPNPADKNHKREMRERIRFGQ
jgi:hypothetical protein